MHKSNKAIIFLCLSALMNIFIPPQVIRAEDIDTAYVFTVNDMDISNIGAKGVVSQDISVGNAQNCDEISALFGISENGTELKVDRVNGIDNTGSSDWDGYIEKTINADFEQGRYIIYLASETNYGSASCLTRSLEVWIDGESAGTTKTVAESQRYSTSTGNALLIMPVSFSLNHDTSSMTVKIQAPQGSSAPNFVAMALIRDTSPYSESSFYIDENKTDTSIMDFSPGTHSFKAEYLTESSGGILSMKFYENGSLAGEFTSEAADGDISQYIIEEQYTLTEQSGGFRVTVDFISQDGTEVTLADITEREYRLAPDGTAPAAGDEIGFIGDSITHADDPSLAAYEDLIYEYYVTHYPERKLTIRNLGISSATAADYTKNSFALLNEYLSMYPDMNKAYIMLGMNDIDRSLYADGVYNTDPDSENAAARAENLQDYSDNISMMTDYLISKGIMVTLMTPSIFDQTKNGGNGWHCNDGLAEAAEILKNIAESKGCDIIDFNSPMLYINDAVQRDNTSSSILDRGNLVHPGNMGYNIMSYIFISHNGGYGTEYNFDAQNETSSRFFYTPSSLPLSITSGYKSADTYTGLSEDINSNIIRIENLPDGTYTLKAYNSVIGTYSATELSDGINISGTDYLSEESSAVHSAILRKHALECALQLQIRYESLGIGSSNTDLDTDEKKMAYISEINSCIDELYLEAENALKEHTLSVFRDDSQELPMPVYDVSYDVDKLNLTITAPDSISTAILSASKRGSNGELEKLSLFSLEFESNTASMKPVTEKTIVELIEKSQATPVPELSLFTFSEPYSEVKPFTTSTISNAPTGDQGITITTSGNNYNNIVITDNTTKSTNGGYYPDGSELPDNGYYLFLGSGGNGTVTFSITLSVKIQEGGAVRMTVAKPYSTNNGSTNRSAGNTAQLSVGSSVYDLETNCEYDEWYEIEIPAESTTDTITFTAGAWSAVAISEIEVIAPPEDYQGKIQVCCIGDSITAGYGIEDGMPNYPQSLQALLGDDYRVVNYGVSSTILCNSGNYPYTSTAQYREALVSEPDIVIIALGTNDTKNGTRSGESTDTDNNYQYVENGSFLSDYIQLVDTFLSLPSQPKVYICLPPYIKGTRIASINNGRLTDGVIPAIKTVSETCSVPVIDLYSVLYQYADDSEALSSYYHDDVHPSSAGAAIIAQAVFDAIAAEK